MRGGALLFLALLMGLPALWFRAPARQQELRVLITGRNMVVHGDGLHLEFQNQPRYRKPPLPYWIAAAAMRLTGNLQSAAVARLPFLLIAVGGLACFLDLTRSDSRWPGLVLISTFVYWQYTPLAETDLPQLAFVLLAFAGWRRGSGTVAGTGMALAALSKGPGGVIIPVLTFLLLRRAHPRPLRFWLPALLIPLTAAGAWVAFLLLDPVAGEALRRELSDTFVDSTHSNPIFYYVYTLPLALGPALLYGVVLWRVPKSRPVSPDARIALVWLAVTFVLLSLIDSKQRHYALLLLPPAAWWIGVQLECRVRAPRVWTPFLVGLFLFALPAAAYLSREEDAVNARFLRRISADVPDQGLIHVVGVNSAIFDFHLGRHVHNTDTARAALRRARPGDAVVIVQKRSRWRDPGLPVTPAVQADDGTWIRRFYLPGHPSNMMN